MHIYRDDAGHNLFKSRVIVACIGPCGQDIPGKSDKVEAYSNGNIIEFKVMMPRVLRIAAPPTTAMVLFGVHYLALLL